MVELSSFKLSNAYEVTFFSSSGDDFLIKNDRASAVNRQTWSLAPKRGNNKRNVCSKSLERNLDRYLKMKARQLNSASIAVGSVVLRAASFIKRMASS
ncbi:hypothetical protein WICPIJ_005751 [Wickerhamomyces pijperi]|uniref:Uncharacterized protein n=1 Tax=Wickerhamomyces pijperi TaxID=599730 RepID=A0A9P8Q300_WICPI|nr:hypothetical protein WICPIJ_005751 [Wickerhamomyces pijperi]